jgi:hypothetical protein
MRTLYFSTVLLFLVSCNNNINDIYRQGLKGNVKSVSSKKFIVSDNEEILLSQTTINFDKKGNINEVLIYDKSGFLYARIGVNRLSENRYTETLFNSSGIERLIFDVRNINKNKTVMEYVDTTLQLPAKKTSLYNKTGKLLSVKDEIEIDTAKEIWIEMSTETCTYDPNENLRSLEKINSKGDIESQENYEYKDFDEKNNPIKVFVYGSQSNTKPQEMIIKRYEYY